MHHKITLHLSAAYYRTHRACIMSEKVTLICSEEERVPSGSGTQREFNHQPPFHRTETWRLGEGGKDCRRVCMHPSSAGNGTRPGINRPSASFHPHKIRKRPDTEKFTLFIIASNSLSTRRRRRGESLCSNSSVSPCWSCDTKMLSPLPPPSLCLRDN